LIAIDFLRSVKTLAWREYVLFPKANLIDYYKLFFQGTFGPGHIVTDKKQAYDNLVKELKDFGTSELPFLQDISFINPYCRISLEIIEKKLMELDEFFDLFMESSNYPNTLSPIEWNEAWIDIENILFQILPKLKDTKLIEMLHDNLYGDKLPMFRHSEQFRETYHPHYRLIRKDLIPSHILLYP
jgi:hypothetical protein